MVRFIVGITGGSGVGKTTLINLLYKEFQGRVSTFSLDNYYRPKEEQIKDENGVINFDLPTALNDANLKKDLELLVSGQRIEQPVYGFNNPEHEKQHLYIDPRELLIVEGYMSCITPF